MNELFQDAADGHAPPDGYITSLSEECRRTMAEVWAVTRGGRVPALEKYDSLLRSAGAPLLDRKSDTVKDAEARPFPFIPAPFRRDAHLDDDGSAPRGLLQIPIEEREDRRPTSSADCSRHAPRGHFPEAARAILDRAYDGPVRYRPTQADVKTQALASW